MRSLFILLSSIPFLLLAACSSFEPCPPAELTAPPFAPAERDVALFLIGDAGEPDGVHTLAALGEAVGQAIEELGEERVLVVFLGDNLYPDGFPAPSDARFREMETKLALQVDALARSSSDRAEPSAPERPLAIFVPGNHDWNHDAADGPTRIRRQQAYVLERSRGRAQLWPGDGCPGPRLLDVGESLRLIALDTHWWIRKADKPGPDDCPTGTPEAVTAELERLLASAGTRRVVVAGHHPFLSGGPHGATTGVRGLGLVPQDLSHRRYRSLIAAVTGAFEGHPPSIYAAGHDHGLQLLEGRGFPYQIVSGGGSAAHLTDTGRLDETLFCSASAGFLRLDVARDGRLRLTAIAVDPGGAREIFSSELSGPSTAPPGAAAR